MTASARFFPGPVGAQDPGGDDRPAELTGAEEGSGAGEAQGGVIAPLQLRAACCPHRRLLSFWSTHTHTLLGRMQPPAPWAHAGPEGAPISPVKLGRQQHRALPRLHVHSPTLLRAWCELSDVQSAWRQCLSEGQCCPCLGRPTTQATLVCLLRGSLSRWCGHWTEHEGPRAFCSVRDVGVHRGGGWMSPWRCFQEGKSQVKSFYGKYKN